MANDNRQSKDYNLSVIDASGRQISLLNDNRRSDSIEHGSPQSHSLHEPTTTWMTPLINTNTVTDQQQQQKQQQKQQTSTNSKRKYHCTEPGCNKSFTTSGHLARHNRIHSGEKNFPCLFPGCQSRFSRQDNMMQHYRTHMSPKSRRTPKRPSLSEESHPRPRLHAHHRIRFDPYRVDPPLTIDQHLSNYHRSLVSPLNFTNQAAARSSASVPPSPSSSLVAPLTDYSSATSSSSNRLIVQQPAPASAPASRTITPSLSSIITTSNDTVPYTPTTTTTSTTTIIPSRQVSNGPVFYQHRPLVYHAPDNDEHAATRPSAGAGHQFSFTLLHPPPLPTTASSSSSIDHPSSDHPVLPSSSSASPSTTITTEDKKNDSLLQLAHIVSTFG